MNVSWEKSLKGPTTITLVALFSVQYRFRSMLFTSVVSLKTGELEITFVKGFCRAGNLSALLVGDKLPELLKPYATRLQSIYDPPPRPPKKLSNSNLDPINNNLLNLIVRYLNSEKADACTWLLPDEWCQKKGKELFGCVPIQPRAFFYKQIEYMDVSFSTFTANANNSFIKFAAGSNTKTLCMVGYTPSVSIVDHQNHLRILGTLGFKFNAFRLFLQIRITLCCRLNHQIFRCIFMLGGQQKIVLSD